MTDRTSNLRNMGMDTPWPLRDVLAKLIEAADHLLSTHGCDAHGHEEVRTAMLRGRDYLTEMRQVETTDVTRDARRYRRLQVLGCAVMNTSQFAQGLVSRWTNLDAIVDADLKAHPSRGENSSLEPACLCARRNEQIVETHLVCPIHSMKASEQCPEQWKDFYGYVRCRLPAGHEGPHGPSEKAK